MAAGAGVADGAAGTAASGAGATLGRGGRFSVANCCCRVLLMVWKATIVMSLTRWTSATTPSGYTTLVTWVLGSKSQLIAPVQSTCPLASMTGLLGTLSACRVVGALATGADAGDGRTLTCALLGEPPGWKSIRLGSTGAADGTADCSKEDSSAASPVPSPMATTSPWLSAAGMPSRLSGPEKLVWTNPSVVWPV